MCSLDAPMNDASEINFQTRTTYNQICRVKYEELTETSKVSEGLRSSSLNDTPRLKAEAREETSGAGSSDGFSSCDCSCCCAASFILQVVSADPQVNRTLNFYCSTNVTINWKIKIICLSIDYDAAFVISPKVINFSIAKI